MENLLKKHQNIVAAAAIVLSASVLYVSLLENEELPKVEWLNFDKFVHFAMYLVLTFSYYFGFFINKEKNRTLIYAAILTFIFGLIVEIMQYYCTNTRQFDILDVIANSTGIFFAYLTLYLVRIQKSKV